jgi:mxaJ protein
MAPYLRPVLTLAALLLCVTGLAQAQRSLRVCADPNNLPFSNRRHEGFENRIAELLARDLGARLSYVWWPQRRGFVRRTLDAGRCDLVVGVPAGFGPTLTTRPYYRSTYVFVTRAAGGPTVRSFDDSVLRTLRIGVHFTGGGNPPPAEAMARRGLTHNLVGFSIYGDYRSPNPPARLLEAVARGEVDVAVAWGPLAGWFARRSPVPLRLAPVPEHDASPGAPMSFDIALGVRHGDTLRLRRLQQALDRNAAGIRGILREYGVPLVEEDSLESPSPR